MFGGATRNGSTRSLSTRRIATRKPEWATRKRSDEKKGDKKRRDEKPVASASTKTVFAFARMARNALSWWTVVVDDFVGAL
jgi:hypothetical protein